MSDLYEKCQKCKDWSLSVWRHCDRCHQTRYVKTGITTEDVASVQDCLERGAPMMIALRTEVTRLEGLLKEARDAVERRDLKNQILMRAVCNLAKQLGMGPEDSDRVISEARRQLVAEAEADSDARRN